jgi:hypothetical protein
MKRTFAALLAAAAILLAGITGSAAVSASGQGPSQDSSVAIGWWPNAATQGAAQAIGWWPNATTQVSPQAIGWWPNSTPSN